MKTTIPSKLQRKIYEIILIFCSALSFICIIGNQFSGFPLSLSIKWALLAVFSTGAYILDIRLHKIPRSITFFFLFVILVFLPYAFIESGGSDNNALGYTFLMAVCITYLFKEKKRIFMISVLTIVFMILLLIEYTHPEVLGSFSPKTQFTDRMIQVPLQVIAVFLIVRSFANAYDQTYEEVRVLAVTDELTGISNRTRLNELCLQFCEEVRTQGRRLCIVMGDIDDFKQVNDTYGHLAGDTVLIEFSDLISAMADTKGLIGRWGGEEFLMLFPDMGLEDTERFIQEMKGIVGNHVFSHAGHLTCSFGIANVTEADTVTTMVQRADNALYEAKRGGKDCIRIG